MAELAEVPPLCTLWVAPFFPEDLRAPPWVTTLSQDVLAALVAPLPRAPRWACDKNLALATGNLVRNLQPGNISSAGASLVVPGGVTR